MLEVTSWTGRLYYNGFSNLLGSGMNVHLKENGLIRSIFNLDETEVEEGQKAKGNRFERVSDVNFTGSTERSFSFLAIS